MKNNKELEKDILVLGRELSLQSGFLLLLLLLGGLYLTALSFEAKSEDEKLESQIKDLQANHKILQEHIYKIIVPVHYPNTDKGVK